MNPELPPLPPLADGVDLLLNAERGFPPVPRVIEARMWAALAPQVPVTLPKPVPHAGVVHASALAKVAAKWPLAVAFALGGGAGA